MRVDLFDYDLPEELIAQSPADPRDAARMMVLHRDSGARELRTFREFPSFLRPGDCLVVNDTRVVPARLFGKRAGTGGRVEILLLREIEGGRWQCLLKPGRRLHPGDRVQLDGADATIAVAGRSEDGTFEIVIESPDPAALIGRVGHMPLPPYIRRPDTPEDRTRYQTVYARKPGAVAAPTAGLHFTSEILERIRDKQVDLARVTLHVGPGTFRPVKSERVENHVMHAEPYELRAEEAARINRAVRRGGRVIAVGTTSVRVLESLADGESGRVRPGAGETRLFLHPPARPKVTGGLLTNFHLPRSTLLMLVCTFASTEHVLAAYRRAVEERFRFYSYGDCMLLI
ncbi:MAG: tRNA preQ1(34) S-adenosylmethionine ribosyltransferase-isomerase QueA [Kiritimatiellaeota bacterium]|nr:tRNA preQ1(34) S-adenosylmethionine ribosyltransferase-isomerase QueA [Kiritimatiellota bacterium]